MRDPERRHCSHSQEISKPVCGAGYGAATSPRFGRTGDETMCPTIRFVPSLQSTRISRIRVHRQIYSSDAKIRLMRSEIKKFETILLEILCEICEDPTYASPNYARYFFFPNVYIHLFSQCLRGSQTSTDCDKRQRTCRISSFSVNSA